MGDPVDSRISAVEGGDNCFLSSEPDPASDFLILCVGRIHVFHQLSLDRSNPIHSASYVA